MRLVSAGWLTLGEAKGNVTRDEVLTANEWLDAQEEAQEEASRR